ncbi:G protein-coupled receptor 137Ba-like [Xenia sp. Carnegie-2017]|uniref:G protein-coupled receptor 137Ba-like n=1 Tax=Xenia sp. Carnegie-2017 TaxID=2897299 RepID=UPI001F041823|nr:G protein-coupled receptor 137Ba-like [Xenia sp. Carnegie-2017]
MDIRQNLMEQITEHDHESKTTVPISKLSKSLPIGVQLSLTVVFTTLYALLFLLIWMQLILILVYKHKRISYQTAFLYICLLWAALRTVLFSFYFNDSCKANELPLFLKWLLYSFPIFLQFCTLSLLALYFSKVVLKSLTTYEPHVRYRKQRCLYAIFFGVNFIFLTLNVTDVILVEYETCCTANIILTRVIVNESLFIFTSFALCYCIIKLSKASTGNLLLEGQGTSLCQALIVSTIIGLVYTSRAVYNIIAVIPKVKLPTFGYGWINVSDEGEAVEGKDLTTHAARNYGYASLGVVLFCWEFLPTLFVVVFFRVKRPQRGLGSMLSTSKENRKAYFFDNDNRYNSEDDLPGSTQNLAYDIPDNGRSNQGPYTINNSSLHRIHSYGSTGQSSSTRSPYSYPSPIKGITPTRLLSDGNDSLLATNGRFDKK